MNVTVPKQLVIGPHTYEVRTDDDTARSLREENRRGDSQCDRCLIRLDLDLPHSQIAETLLHETIHCAWAQTSLSEVDALRDHEEGIVRSLAPLLLHLLRANPTFVNYLTAA